MKSVSGMSIYTYPMAQPSPLAALNVMGREVLAFLGRAMSNKEIAETMQWSPETIKPHLQRRYPKLGVRSRAEAMSLFYGQAGSLPPFRR